MLSLGQRLADALDEQDLLARWMAHHLAERMTRLETLTGAGLQQAQDEVASLILQLWQQRRQGPFSRQPLGSIDEVERALQRLDPARSPWSFHAPFGQTAVAVEGSAATVDLLQVALETDRTSGDLVRALIRVASASAIAEDEDEEWVTAAAAADERSLRWLNRLIEQDPAAPDGGESTVWNELTHRAESMITLCQQLLAVASAANDISAPDGSGTG